MRAKPNERRASCPPKSIASPEQLIREPAALNLACVLMDFCIIYILLKSSGDPPTVLASQTSGFREGTDGKGAPGAGWGEGAVQHLARVAGYLNRQGYSGGIISGGVLLNSHGFLGASGDSAFGVRKRRMLGQQDWLPPPHPTLSQIVQGSLGWGEKDKSVASQ